MAAKTKPSLDNFEKGLNLAYQGLPSANEEVKQTRIKLQTMWDSLRKAENWKDSEALFKKYEEMTDALFALSGQIGSIIGPASKLEEFMKELVDQGATLEGIDKNRMDDLFARGRGILILIRALVEDLTVTKQKYELLSDFIVTKQAVLANQKMESLTKDSVRVGKYGLGIGITAALVSVATVLLFMYQLGLLPF